MERGTLKTRTSMRLALTQSGIGKGDEDAVADYVSKLKAAKASIDEALRDAEEFLAMLKK